jgi:2,3-bisphosphoglycerate-dependent phosphoglycerate mutase
LLPTTFYFVRHAQPNYENHDDSLRELTEKGLRDRLLVTDFLEDKNIGALLSSPYKRAVDTIRHFADKHGMEIHIIDDFRERKVDNNWAIVDFSAFVRRQWDDFHYKLPGGECLHEVQRRNIAALTSAQKEYRGKNIAVGSHGAALSTIISYFDKSFVYYNHESIPMPWVVKFVFDGKNCVEIEKIDLFSL